MDYLEKLKIKREVAHEKQKEKTQAEIIKAIGEQTKVLEQVRDLLKSPKEK